MHVFNVFITAVCFIFFIACGAKLLNADWTEAEDIFANHELITRALLVIKRA